ncbi:hypothetical protein STEG23_003122, partial [Scotinomys teguina]
MKEKNHRQAEHGLLEERVLGPVRKHGFHLLTCPVENGMRPLIEAKKPKNMVDVSGLPLTECHLRHSECSINHCGSSELETDLPKRWMSNLIQFSARETSGFCYHRYWTLTQTPLGYPAVALSHGDPAASVLQDWPLHHGLQQFIDGVDIGVQRSPNDGRTSNLINPRKVEFPQAKELSYKPTQPYINKKGNTESNVFFYPSNPITIIHNSQKHETFGKGGVIWYEDT